MKQDKLYLSEEELDALVASIEADGLIAAPPGTEEAVLRKLGRRSAATRPRRQLTPAAELRRYCLQVSAAVAAAILLVFTAPSWEQLRPEKKQEREEPHLPETILHRQENTSDLWELIFDDNGG